MDAGYAMDEARPNEDAQSMCGTQQLVVVVEDDIGIRDALRRWLLASGYRARAFESAEALLAADGSVGADCLVLDVRLSGMSGIDLYGRLGSGRPPAVFITAHVSETVRGVAARLGNAPVLPKPFLAADLLDAIARVTGPTGKPTSSAPVG
jgi:FixJ family two-component response regulator